MSNVLLEKEAINFLNKVFLLPYTGQEQDWDIEMADSQRLDEFICYYQSNSLSENKKYALIALILASYDDFLSENNIEVDKRWKTIESLLNSDINLYTELIDYWSLTQEKGTNYFRITPLIREIKCDNTSE